MSIGCIIKESKLLFSKFGFHVYNMDLMENQMLKNI